ncbi:MAG: SGNH/GDSL hydrolase family protein [Elusimicrobia bacterium]|nr:SGNH/GDSL hydrolase family protein [Elusimicrobiota bacterium]
MRAPLLTAALILAVTAPAAAERVLIIADSHTVGPFGTSLEARLRAKGADTAMDAVCGASSTWWLGVRRAKLSICYSVHGYGGKNAPQNGAPAAFPPTAAQLAASKPDVVVLALGSNPDGSPADTAAAAEKLISVMPPDARCVWVGPPPMPKRRAAILELYKLLPKALLGAARSGPSCALIDSRDLISPQNAAANDHFYGASAAAWGKAVADRILP